MRERFCSFGFNETVWGSLAQWQTLRPVRSPSSRYYGYDLLDFHPYELLPRLSLSERFASFNQRLAKVQERHQ